MDRIILASGSPRRKQLLEWAEIPFDILVKETPETWPPGLAVAEVPVFIARNKALAVKGAATDGRVILVLYLCEIRPSALQDPDYTRVLARLFKFAIVYAGFAFISSLIREVVKDIEDMEGDARYGCRTMPIVWGVNVAKVFAGTWVVVLTGSLVVIQVYALQRMGWPMVIYGVLLLDLPLTWILRKLYQAQTKKDYHLLSSAIKGVMLAGILSMLIIYFT